MKHTPTHAKLPLAIRGLATLLASAAFALTAPGALLVSTDFNGTSSTGPLTVRNSDNSAVVNPYSYVSGGSASLAVDNSGGTVDAARTATKALKLTANFNNVGYRQAALFTGKFSNLSATFGVAQENELMLGLDLKVNKLHPVTVTIRSFDGNTLTGASTTTVIPPVTGSYYRHTFDLSTMATEGATRFNPLSPQIEVVVAIVGTGTTGWPGEYANSEITVDNISLASTSAYVDQVVGNAPGTEFRGPGFAASGTIPVYNTIQAALNASAPGAVIAIRNGTYSNPSPGTDIVNLSGKNGGPAKWYVLRKFPGQNSVLLNVTGWNGIGVNSGTTSYIEIRDLNIKGQQATTNATAANNDALILTLGGAAQIVNSEGKLTNKYYGNPIYNGNGINIDGRSYGNSNPNDLPHHIRVIGNTVYDHCAGGISLTAADYITIEGNISYANSRYSRSATSGVSILNSWNYDASSSVYKSFVLRNRVFINRVTSIWTDLSVLPSKGGPGIFNGGPGTLTAGVLSDGNGIIVDRNLEGRANTQTAADNGTFAKYRGLTLVQNNLSYGNGAAGLQSVVSQNVHFINNSTHQNNTTLNYGELMINASQDIKSINNSLVASSGKLCVNYTSSSSGAVFKTNIFNGGTISGAVPSIDYVTGSPLYTAPGTTGAANYTFPSNSPARNAGTREQGTPINDFRGNVLRPQSNAVELIDIGAYEF